MNRQLVFVVACVLLVFVGSVVSAETIIYYEPHTGHRETFDSASPGRFAQPTIVHSRVGGATRGGTITWNVTYNDVVNNTGVGFDAGGGLDATRQATAEAVLDYITTVLNETTGANLSVVFQNSQTDGTGFLASAGTFFFVGTGFTSGHAHQHITTGTDPSGSADITCTVDFGYTWNSDQGSPTFSEFDLFTVLLHEMTHGLGFLNGSDATGASVIGGQYANLARLTHNDDSGTIGTGSSSARWVLPGNFTGPSSDLIGGRLVFTGTNAVAAFGSNPTIYSANPFISGSSLSHWGDDQAGVAVMPRFVFNGAEFRTYANFEIGALQDIGYSNAATVGPPDTDQDLLSDDDEINIYGTDPNDIDTDDDGVIDGTEIEFGTDPLDDLDFPLLPVRTTAVVLAVFALLTVSGCVIYRRYRGARIRN